MNVTSESEYVGYYVDRPLVRWHLDKGMHSDRTGSDSYLDLDWLAVHLCLLLSVYYLYGLVYVLEVLDLGLVFTLSFRHQRGLGHSL